MSNVTADQIVTIAENMIRTKGYYSFSFREIANQIGIKSSSVHYHFPTKGILAEAVAMRYSEQFFATLNQQTSGGDNISDILESYLAMFKHALTVDKKLCLCGMLGAEKALLPDNVLAKVKAFFQSNLNWLFDLAQEHHSTTSEAVIYQRAGCFLASLEGAMIISQTLEQDEFFAQISQRSKEDFLLLFS